MKPIPPDLIQRRQWITWRLENDKKLPNCPWLDSSNWESFDEVSLFDRIGFVFTADDDLCGIDLDGCINADGSYQEWATEILVMFQGKAYAEISPSGTGVKIWTRAKKPEGALCRKTMGEGKTLIECYDKNRWFAVTGRVIEFFDCIGDGQSAVDWLVEKYLRPELKPQPAKLQDYRPASGGNDIYSRARCYVEKASAASNGTRNSSAFSLAGNLFAFTDGNGGRLSEDKVLELVRTWNSRNPEPLGDDEIRATVRSAQTKGTPRADKPPLVDANEHYAQYAFENEKPALIKPIAVNELIKLHPKMRPYVIDGVLRNGETANVIAASKTGKSFLAAGLAWSIATGTPWLGHNVEQGKVLILDNELHPETLSHRLRDVADSMQIDFEQHPDNVEVINLRSLGIDLMTLRHKVSIEPGRYRLVVVDALYRFIPLGVSENDNAAMMRLYNVLDELADEWQSAIAVVHHSSKGAQGDKVVTDVGAGAGAISRAADTHIVIRPHNESDLSVMEIVCRSCKSPEPVSIKYEYPLWYAVATDAVLKCSRGGREEKQQADDLEADRKLHQALDGKFCSASQIVRRTGMGPDRVNRAIGRGVSAGHLEQKRVKRNGKSLEIYRVNRENATLEGASR